MSLFMYNIGMLKSLLLVLVLVAFGGCATSEVYNPLQAPSKQTLLINASSLKQIAIGQTADQVHQIMGDELIIGYSYQNTSSEQSAYKPITIANPYKKETRVLSRGECIVEYYVTTVHHPDGVVADDEMVPLVFYKDVLVAQGWDSLK